MERRVRRKSHARCEAGENPVMTSRDYLSLLTARLAQYDVSMYFTDRYEGYAQLIPPEQLLQGFIRVATGSGRTGRRNTR